MSAEPRTLITSGVTPTGRTTVYETADGVVVEANEQYEILHRRVLFEDVVLVTYHRETGWGYVLANGFIAFVFLFIGGSIFAARASMIAAAIFAVLGLPSLVLLILRLALSVDVVTVFGRRSKAIIRFPWNKRRARETYGRICARARQVQQRVGAENPEPDVALPPGPELSAADVPS